MFDIKIGTLIPAIYAPTMIPKLNPKGFECYELNFSEDTDALLPVVSEHSKQVAEALEGRGVSCIGFYGNPILNEKDKDNFINIIKIAHLYGCDTIGAFGGCVPGQSVPDTIPAFKKVFTEICKVAEDCGVRIGIEGCGGGWNGNWTNIGFCAKSWDMMFDAVDSPALGLEWEPAHTLCQLADPISQLRRFAKKVVHLHGKDVTLAWDVIRNYGTDAGEEFSWHRLPGFGDTNWSDIFTILLQNGFEGACDIEGYHDPVHYDDMEWTAQTVSLDYLKRCRGGVEYFRGPTEYVGYQGKRKK